MNDETLLKGLRRISRPNYLRCDGYGYEHNCSAYGCAIINEAIQRLEGFSEHVPNYPLTVVELREMKGYRVWIVQENRAIRYALIRFSNKNGISTDCFGFLPWETMTNEWKAFRRRPEVADV